MSQKIKTRIQNKHDVEANWVQAVNFIPMAGEAIVYDQDSNYSSPRIKIGDGQTTINNLPFCTGVLLEEEGMDVNTTLSVSNSAASHNAIFRGMDLTNKYTIDQICERIASGTFEDLYIGDYFDITFTNRSGREEQMRCILAAFDYYYTQQRYGCNRHHAVIIPKNCIGGYYIMNINDTNLTEGGYTGSEMFTTTLPALVTPLQTALNNHIITHKNYLASAINGEGNSAAGAGMVGYASSAQYKDVTITIPNEIQVYGTQVWSSSPYNVGLDTTILPLFAHNPIARVCGKRGVADGGEDGWGYWWLRDVVSADYFAGVDTYGHASYDYAYLDWGLRPLFLIG